MDEKGAKASIKKIEKTIEEEGHYIDFSKALGGEDKEKEFVDWILEHGEVTAKVCPKCRNVIMKEDGYKKGEGWTCSKCGWNNREGEPRYSFHTLG